jgi:hypothetical protein
MLSIIYKLFKNFIKFLLRTQSVKRYRNDELKAHKSAYKHTSEKIARGKKYGYYVNGKSTYQRELNKQLKHAMDRKEIRDKTIDDL